MLRFYLDINPFIIQLHITQTIYGILSVMADNHVWAGNGNRQNTSITFKTTRQLTVLIVQTSNFSNRAAFLVSSFFSVDLERVTPRSFIFRFLSCSGLLRQPQQRLSRLLPSARFQLSISISIKRSIWAFNLFLLNIFFFLILFLYTFKLLLQIR